jgi:DnaK suppressor protein
MQLQTQTHLPMLRDLLTYRLTDLRADIHSAEMARRERSSEGAEVFDRKDEADLNQTLVTEEAQEARDRAELRQVEAALQRLTAGVYGDCADCAEPIDLQRLLAQPAAERCAVCQSVFEHRALR